MSEKPRPKIPGAFLPLILDWWTGSDTIRKMTQSDKGTLLDLLIEQRQRGYIHSDLKILSKSVGIHKEVLKRWFRDHPEIFQKSSIHLEHLCNPKLAKLMNYLGLSTGLNETEIEVETETEEEEENIPPPSASAPPPSNSPASNQGSSLVQPGVHDTNFLTKSPVSKKQHTQRRAAGRASGAKRRSLEAEAAAADNGKSPDCEQRHCQDGRIQIWLPDDPAEPHGCKHAKRVACPDCHPDQVNPEWRQYYPETGGNNPKRQETN